MNFRNEKLNGLSPEATFIDDAFLADVPTSGFLEFGKKSPSIDVIYFFSCFYAKSWIRF